MNDSQITIFYSWQSDLPGNETRNIIQDGIKDAVRLLRDTVDIEADRDTKGEYGSPDIANTIFSKIDECDIFVADVSAVCKYEVTDKDGNIKTKYMPNPNVMLELGYATHVVGWENVICVLNADYGAPEDMPFDIASRRLTPFSLKDGSSKGDAKRFVKSVIQETVEHILENGKRVKSGFSDLRIGTYIDGMICNKVVPYSIASSTKYIANKQVAIDECIKLFEEIKAIKLSACTLEPEDTLEDFESTSPETITTKDGTVLTPIKNPLNVNLFKAHRVSVKEDDRIRVSRVTNYRSVDYSTIKNFVFNVTKDIRMTDIPTLKQKLEQQYINLAFDPAAALSDLRLNSFTKKYIKNILARITGYIEEQTGVASNYCNYMNTQTKNPFEIEHIITDHYEWFTAEYSDQDDFRRWRNSIGALLLLHKSINASLNDAKYDYKLKKYCSNEGNIYTESLGELAYQNNPKFKKFIADNNLGFKAYASFGKNEITERIAVLVDLVKLVWNDDLFQ